MIFKFFTFLSLLITAIYISSNYFINPIRITFKNLLSLVIKGKFTFISSYFHNISHNIVLKLLYLVVILLTEGS